jgi:hypothetical protein
MEKHTTLLRSLIGIVLILGIGGALFLAHYEFNERKNELTKRAIALATILDIDELQTLEGNSSDLDKPEYRALKTSLTQASTLFKDTRFVYLMGYNGTKLYFKVDSEDPQSQDYSPPGQIYTESSETQILNFINGVSFAEGPYTDRWGTWISAYAPVKGVDGTTVAIVGIDVHAWSTLLHIGLISSIPLIIAFFLLLLILIEHRAHALGTSIHEIVRGKKRGADSTLVRSGAFIAK